MLFAGLQRQAIGPVAIGINRHANNTPRHRPLIGILGCHIGRMWATIPHRHTKTLGAANRNISLHGTGFFEQGQRQRIGTDNPNGLGQMQRCDWIGKVLNMTVSTGVLKNCTKHLCGIQGLGGADDDVNTQRRRTGLHHSDILRMAVLINEKHLHFRFSHPLRHGHRFGTGCGFIQQRSVSDL